MSIAGIKACSFFDDTPGSPTEGVVVQFNRVTEDSQCYTNAVTEKDFAGHSIHAGDESLLDIGVMDYDGKMDQMRAWMRAGTKLKFVAAGVQSNILWYEPCEITLQEPTKFATGSRNVVRVKMMAEGGQHKIWKGVNLLHGAVVLQGYETGWQDSNGDNLADGYTAGAVTPTSFISGVQSLTVDSGIGRHQIKFIFPLANTTLKLSLHSVTTATIDKIIQFSVDFLGATIQTKSVVKSAGGRNNSVLVTSSDVWHIIAVLCESTSTGDTSSFKDPALRVDGSDEYIAG